MSFRIHPNPEIVSNTVVSSPDLQDQIQQLQNQIKQVQVQNQLNQIKQLQVQLQSELQNLQPVVQVAPVQPVSVQPVSVQPIPVVQVVPVQPVVQVAPVPSVQEPKVHNKLCLPQNEVFLVAIHSPRSSPCPSPRK